MAAPRVFVSSVMEGYKAFRDAARAGITAAGAEPVLAEDFPAMPATPRNACLDGVASADALVLLVSGRGGWKAPSGRLAVEEEFEEAQNQKLPTLVFVEETSRDETAEMLNRRVTEYVAGRFRRTFNTPEELQELVEHAVREAFTDGSTRSTAELNVIIDDLLAHPTTFGNEASIRLVLVPERDEQVLDPVEFERAPFRTLVNEVGHSGERPLLSYDFGKSYEVAVDSFTLVQAPEGRGKGPLSSVSVQLHEDGAFIVDISVSGSATDGSMQAMQGGFTVQEQDIEEAMLRAFGFCSALLQRIDKFGRHQRFNYNVVLHGLGYRTLAGDARPRRSYGMRMRDEDVTAFGRSRLVSRADIAAPESEVEAVLTMLRRQLSGP